MFCENTIRSEENNIGWYLKNLNESLLKGVKHVRIPKLRQSVSLKDFKKLLNEKRVENWKREKKYTDSYKYYYYRYT